MNAILTEIKNNFLQELIEAKSGKPTSLAFIINQIPQASLVQENELFQVIVIGGTVCKSALVKRTQGEIVILKVQESKRNPLRTKQEFLALIESLIDNDVTTVSLNFAQALQPVFENGKLDGILLNGSKENTYDGLVGQKVGETIEHYFLQKDNRTITVSVANDTICLLLSGLTKHSWKELAACIIGSGYNSALFLEEDTVVNLEAGKFNKFSLSQQAKIIDAASAEPGAYLFEKEIAGSYLFHHFNLLINARKINYQEINSTQEINKALAEEHSEAHEVAREVLDHSACLVAGHIAGILEFLQRNTVFVTEGSLFWKAIGYKEMVETKIKELTPNFTAEFIHIEDSSIIGAVELVSKSVNLSGDK